MAILNLPMPKPPRKQPVAGRATAAESVPAAAFKAKSLELVAQVRERGVEYVITRHGRPVARLVPADATPPTAIGFLHGTVVAQRDIVSPDFATWDPDSDGPPSGRSNRE